MPPCHLYCLAHYCHPSPTTPPAPPQAVLEPGTTYVFEVEVTNAGVLPSSPISLSAIPADAPVGTTTLFPIAALDPGSSADIVFQVMLPADAGAGAVFAGTLDVLSGLGSYPLNLQFTSGTNVTGSLTVEVDDEVGGGTLGKERGPGAGRQQMHATLAGPEGTERCAGRDAGRWLSVQHAACSLAQLQGGACGCSTRPPMHAPSFPRCS